MRFHFSGLPCFGHPSVLLMHMGREHPPRQSGRASSCCRPGIRGVTSREPASGGCLARRSVGAGTTGGGHCRSAFEPLRPPLPPRFPRLSVADHGHGPVKVNAWEAPTDPEKWKGEHVRSFGPHCAQGRGEEGGREREKQRGGLSSELPTLKAACFFHAWFF